MSSEDDSIADQNAIYFLTLMNTDWVDYRILQCKNEEELQTQNLPEVSGLQTKESLISC